jgi:type IV pilus assembly protein PilW
VKSTTTFNQDNMTRLRQNGFSIVEMMVAMTVTIFIIGALVTVVIGSSATGRTRDVQTELQTNGRYALEQIKNDLLHAGYVGISSLFWPDEPITTASSHPAAINVGNACDPLTVGQLSQRIWGTNDNNPFSATCIPAANYLAGDLLMIRALDPNPVTAPFSTTRVYYHSAYEGGQPFVGPTAPDFTVTSKQPPYLDFEMKETVYYVSPYTTAVTENPQVPALYRTVLGNGPAMIPELVASGVENLQIRYGVFQANSSVRYMSAAEMAPTDWDIVRSVQIWLLMRSTQGDAGYANTNTYTLGTQNITVNDNFRRLLVRSVIELRN